VCKVYITLLLLYAFPQDFQFKLLSRLRVFTAQDGTFTSAVNLVATASKYGLIFVGCPSGIQGMTYCSRKGNHMLINLCVHFRILKKDP